jgi:hypothetical protein
MPIYQCVTSKVLSREIKAAIAKALLKSLSAAWSRLTGQPERNLVLRVEEADAATIMEAGLIMPRPGEEAAWFAANKAVLGELQAAA